MTFKQILRLAIGVLLAVFFIWLIISQIHLSELKTVFSGTIAPWIVAALTAFFVGYACRIERWRLMLKRDSANLRWIDCAGPLFASFAANNVLPFRAGDMLRAFAFNKRLGTTSGIVVATLFVERLLDLLMILVLFGTALVIFGLDVGNFAGVGSAVLIVIAVAILVLLLFPRLFAPIAIALGKLAYRFSPGLGKKLHEEINRSLATLVHLANGGTMARLIAWSGCTWLAEGCVFWFAALALRSIASPSASWLALPVGTLATLIPSTPGYVGTFDYFTVHAMAALGNNAISSTAYALLVHALLWFPPTIAGGLYLLLHPVKELNKSKDI